MEIWPGNAYPLGATYDGTGVNFALFSEVAERVELCLIDDKGRETRFDLPEVDGFVWHGYLPGVQPGQRYGYRVHGPYDLKHGHRCNPSKLLLDPYAKAFDGMADGDASLFSYDFADGEADKPAKLNTLDSLATRCSRWSSTPSSTGARTAPGPRVPRERHLRGPRQGLTELHPDIPEEIRGTYAGIAHPAMIAHLKALGITAIELMPVHQFVQDFTLSDKDLRNYWGYNTIGFLAPHNEYAAYGTRGEQVAEFKGMVKELHEAGIEVILDVVYNHTAEGNHMGPTMCFRGIDNAAYYRLVDEDKAHYYDTTGTGNSLLMRHPHVLQLIMDSLRYWVTEMHVDGFRFDLAATLARQFHEVDKLSAFFDLVQQDPIVSQVKLIAEPWDVGEGGYQVGNFPPLWTEWNGKYRDTVRDFWRGESATLGEFASRITGSSDLYQGDGRHPIASINFVTAHDGFTLRDLVSYNDKHNDANGEGGNDGESHNRSWNCGVEGPTDDRRSPRCACASSATSSPRSWSRRESRCCCTATSSAAPRAATTTATARTTRSPGSTGSSARSRRTCSTSRAAWSSCGASTPSSAAAVSSRAAPTTGAGPTWVTSSGSSPAVSRWTTRAGPTATRGRWLSSSTAPRSPSPTPVGSASSTTASSCSSTGMTSRCGSPCRTTTTARAGSSTSTPGRRTSTPSSSSPPGRR